jgi:citrate synthase
VDFEQVITQHTMLNENLKNFLNGFHYDAHPMAILCGVVGSLSAFYHESIDVNDAALSRGLGASADRQGADHRRRRLQAQRRRADHVSAQRPALRANFLHMMFATPCGLRSRGCSPRRP